MGEANAGADMDLEAGSSESRGIWLTYKRRKLAKTVDEPRFLVKDGAHFVTATSSFCSLNHQRNIVLEEMCQLLECDGGLKKCIHDALAFHPENGKRTTMKECVPFREAGTRYSSGTDGYTKCMKGLTCRISHEKPKRLSITDRCCCSFYDIITSENFSKLCCLLHENGMKVEKLLNFSHINSNMKENTYESFPLLFHSDMLKVWTKIEKVGKDIVALARSITDEARTLFRENELVLMEELDKQHKEATREESCAAYELHTCKQCGEKADGRNGLVCDSCENIYHISCIQPPVIEIPLKSWYCTNCTLAKEIESPHENCVVCERLESSSGSSDYVDEEVIYSRGQEELETLANCKVCLSTVRNDEDHRACGHGLCPHKFYHVKCLTSRELQFHGGCWYCPSCLCRACLVDRDDHKIVLCDGCDHGYHTYCMQPPRERIPKGKWFCKRCDADIQRISKTRSLYEKMVLQNDKSGGVEMLLNAARTLKHEDAEGRKRNRCK